MIGLYAFDWVRKTALTLEMVKVTHSIFAMPFALAALLLASRGLPQGRVLAWVIVAMISARSAAMAFNRLADHDIDSQNPRTKDRALPARLLSRRFVWGFLGVSIAVFVVASAMLNRLCLWLSPVALCVLLGYSYSKRFTVWCHVWLGVALGLTPLAGWVAVRGVVDALIVIPLCMAFAVLFWVTGFDLIYAAQDAEFDHKAGLHSIPARFGVSTALRVSALFHALSALLLALLSPLAHLGRFYAAAVLAAACLLFVEHRLARSQDPRRRTLAFVHVNSAVGLVVFAGVAGDLWWS